MGVRGPAPTPTALLEGRGSWRSGLRISEPVSDVESPPCPKWIQGEAKTEWERIVPELLLRRTLSKSDLAMLAGYCQAWGEFANATRRVNALDTGNKKYKGLMIDHPRVVLGRAFERMCKAAQQFGLSPASKTRLNAEPQKKQSDGKSRFFGQAG
jgi:P27 family predicted phage terminase small subunit